MTAPALPGLSHLGFSVHDVPAAVQFWVEVFGFRAVVEEPGFTFLIRVDVGLAIGVGDHGGAVASGFDERRVGLDHLALAVPNLPVLPFGTALGVYALWILLTNEARRLFEPATAAHLH